MSLDARVTPLREGLAARSLEGTIAAQRYADPRGCVAVAPAAAIRKAPDPDAEQVDQLLFGEAFDVLAEADGFAWGQARRDGYVGYVDTAALGPRAAPPTCKVAAIRTYAFAQPSIKSRAIGPYSLGALVSEEAREGRFVKAVGGAWFVIDHLSPIGLFEPEAAAVAEWYLGAPYLWGGRESLGLDCSGLVQQALMATGRACPRDTDQQAELGAAVARDRLRRGDLVFWKGHVGIMLDETRLLHANAHHMAVAVEPLAETEARYLSVGVGEPTAFRRP